MRTKRLRHLLATLLILSIGRVAAGIEDGPRHAGHPQWMDPGIIDLESDLQTASDAGKLGLMVLFTTQGCTYCAEFIRTSLGDPGLRDRVQEAFIAISLEIFDDAEMTDQHGVDLPIKQFAQRHKAGMAPTLLFFATDGRLIHRAIGYQSPERFAHILDYLTGGHQQRISFREFLRDTRPVVPRDPGVPMRDDPLFVKPPYAFSRTSFRATEPLLVIFESPGCTSCTRFHDEVLAVGAVRRLLQRFEVARLDANDDKTPVIGPDGRPTTPAQWFAREDFSRLPALLYVDEAGETVFKTDAVVERQRMLNATGLVLERAYEKGWSYQRFARSKAIERNRKAR